MISTISYNIFGNLCILQKNQKAMNKNLPEFLETLKITMNIRRNLTKINIHIVQYLHIC